MSAELRALRADPFELLMRIDARLRAARVDAAAGEAQAWVGLGFRIAETWLAAPRHEVREVIAPPRVTRVPNAQAWLTGVANVRGELMTVIDLPLLLGLPPTPPARGRRVLVLNAKRAAPVGFLVDEVAGYRQFAAGEQRNELKHRAGAFSPYLLGALVRDGQAWLAFSLQRLASGDSFRAAAR